VERKRASVVEFVVSGRLVTSVSSVAALPFACNTFNLNITEMAV
jgi:hypothetical protein